MFTLIDVDASYQRQDFYKNYEVQWLPISDLKGINGYCDKEASTAIRERIAGTAKTQLVFLGNGNFHYLSLFMLEQLKEAAALVMFDFHSDMQPSLFPELLSCGCWVKFALDHNPFLKQVILIGAGAAAAAGIPQEYQSRVFVWPQQDLTGSDSLKELSEKIEYPIYMSVDKDVFDRSLVETNWDQGNLNLDQWEKICRCLAKTHRFLGADVCGEYIIDHADFEASRLALMKNSRANSRIVSVFGDCLAGV